MGGAFRIMRCNNSSGLLKTNLRRRGGAAKMEQTILKRAEPRPMEHFAKTANDL